MTALVGSALGGPLSDWIVKLITKHRGGYFVAEFRLWCFLPIFIFGPIGLMLWGAGLQNGLPSMVPIVGTAISYGVLVAVPATAFAYVVDCYRPHAAETITMVTAAKNTFAFGLSFAVFTWIERDGTTKVSHLSSLDGFLGNLKLTPFSRWLVIIRSSRWFAFSLPSRCISMERDSENGLPRRCSDLRYVLRDDHPTR